jgi:hypothetical protein
MLANRVIPEKSNNIPIQQKLAVKNSNNENYSLTQGLFDPSKSSPPNEFMIKLRIRMSQYNNTIHNIKEDNRESE